MFCLLTLSCVQPKQSDVQLCQHETCCSFFQELSEVVLPVHSENRRKSVRLHPSLRKLNTLNLSSSGTSEQSLLIACAHGNGTMYRYGHRQSQTNSYARAKKENLKVSMTPDSSKIVFNPCPKRCSFLFRAYGFQRGVLASWTSYSSKWGPSVSRIQAQ